MSARPRPAFLGVEHRRKCDVTALQALVLGSYFNWSLGRSAIAPCADDIRRFPSAGWGSATEPGADLSIGTQVS